MYDLVIKNANLIDGTGRKAIVSDLAVIGDTIVERGKISGYSKKIIDAEGLTLCPGIIDTHTHYDAQLTWDPTASPSSELGTTTALIGNCGFTIAPCKKKHRELNMRNLQKVEGMPYNALNKGIDWNFKTYSDYLSLLENKNLKINVCSYIGHSALRIWCMGEDAMRREANNDEIKKMEKIVSEAMKNGAIGFSTSTFEGHNGYKGIPMPSRYASKTEIKRLIKAMAVQNRGIFMITKSNSSSISDIKDLLAETNRPAMVAALFYNPLKRNWALDNLEEISNAQKEGFEIWGQVSCRPLSMEFTMREPYMLEGLSSWREYMIEEDMGEKINILKNKLFRKKVLEEIKDTTKNKLFGGDWDKIILLETKNENIKNLEGRNISDIARPIGISPFDWLLDNAINGGIDDLFVAELLNSDLAEVKKLVLHKSSTVSLSDAGAHLSLLCDAGYALDLLGKWVRDYKIMTLEEAVYKLTAKQADICRIPKRGRLVPGFYADMFLFDKKKIGASRTKRVFDLPDGSSRLKVDPIGIKEVWVNGISNNSLDKKSGCLIKSFLT